MYLCMYVSMHNVLLAFHNFYLLLICFIYVLDILLCVSRNSNSEWSLWNKSETLINDLLLYIKVHFKH